MVIDNLVESYRRVHNRMKTWQLLLVLAVLVGLLAACDASEDSDSDEPAATEAVADTGTTATYRVALVMKTRTNPFFVEMERGAREAEADLGIELIVDTAAQETSIEQQIDIVEELIVEEVDAIVIAPGDSQALVPVLARAQDAGIVIVNIDNQLDPDVSASAGLDNVPFISVDNEAGGYLSAQYVANQVSAPTQAIILEGIVTAQNAIDRRDGALRAFGENSNIEVVAQESADWKIDEARTRTEALFEQYPDIGLIFAANDMMALGAIEYLEESGQTDVLVAGYDALPEAMPALTSGMLDATIDQQAARQGYLGVAYAVRILNGESVDLLTLVEVALITPETVAVPE